MNKLSYFSNSLLIAAWLELVVYHLPQNLEVDTEPHLKAALVYIVIFDPNQRVVKLRIYGLDVFHCQFFVQHSFVERHCETRVDESENRVQWYGGGGSVWYF